MKQDKMSIKSYTYLIGWSKLNVWYYGVRYANKTSPSKDLWTKYFTSSTYVKHARSVYGEPDVIQVRKRFSDKDNAVLWEHKVLKRLKVKSNDFWLNKTDHYPNYDRRHYLYYNNGTKEKRILPGFPIPPGFTKGRLPGRSPDPGFNSVTVKDKLGNKFRVLKTDPKYISGEYLHINSGIIHTPEERKTFSNKTRMSCLHCKKVFDPGNFTRHLRSSPFF